jgi:hypothetical protein
LALAKGRATAGNLNAPRLQLLRHFEYELDGEQTILDVGAGDRHVIGETEDLLEAASRNATMQELLLVLVRFLPAGDRQVDAFLSNPATAMVMRY